MRDTRNYSVFPSNLDVCATFKKLGIQLERIGYSEDRETGCDRVGYTVTLSEQRRLRAQDFAEFTEILDEFPNPNSVYIHSHWKSKDVGIGLDVDFSKRRLEVGIDGDLSVVLGIHERVKDVFLASNPDLPKSLVLSRYNLKKSVFLAHRFDEVGSAISNSVFTFLNRLGFQVIEGEGYESRDIPSKVADRIDSQDIFVLIATPGDATWIVSEAAYAKAKEKYLILLVQEGLTISKGIIGADHEHIQFSENSVEKAFSDLLFALPG